MTAVTSIVPYGYAIVQGKCAPAALKKIRDSTCCLIRVRNEKEGEFVVCNGKVIHGRWESKKGEEAWNAFLSYLENSEKPTHLTFYPPPETLSLTEEFEVSLTTAEETGSEYFSGVSTLALGKQVMAIIHKIEALGLEIDDISLNVVNKKAVLKIVKSPGSKSIDVEKLKRIAMEYLGVFGISEVEVIFQ